MSYHDYKPYTNKWTEETKKEETTENPRIQLISPQKKLFDIEQVLKKLPEEPMSMVELQEAIQRIIDR